MSQTAANAGSKARSHARSQMQRGAAVTGVVLIVVGVLGFIPGITTGYSGMRFASDHSTAELFGLFQTSVLHNLVHLVSGIAGLICVRTPLRARNYLLVTGIGYGVIFLYGILVFRRDSLDVLPINNPDNFLHLVIAAALIAMSVLLDCGPTWRSTVLQGKAEI